MSWMWTRTWTQTPKQTPLFACNGRSLNPVLRRELVRALPLFGVVTVELVLQRGWLACGRRRRDIPWVGWDSGECACSGKKVMWWEHVDASQVGGQRRHNNACFLTRTVFTRNVLPYNPIKTLHMHPRRRALA
jgi:hypothetical protein